MFSHAARSALWLLLLACTLIGCGSTPPLTETLTPVPATETSPPTDAPTATVTPTSTLSPEPTSTPMPPVMIGPDSYPANVNPLTGLTVSDPSVLERRPLVIKISNAPPVVRPQSSTSQADVIFEHYAEGGWTRFTAIFYSTNPVHVGSVRSVRLVDLQLTPAFDGILIFSGGSLGVIDTLRQAPIYPKQVISPQFGYAEPQFVRFPREGLPFEHTLFTDTNELWSVITAREINRRPRFSSPGWAFSDQPPDGGSPANSVQLDFARTSVIWRYDPVSQKYLRWTDGIPHNDALTGRQLAFDNVMAISTYHEEQVLFEEKYFGAEHSLYIELQGEGPATLLRNGQSYEGRWVREEEGDIFTFYSIDEKPLLLKPGKTFFEIIRTGFEQLIVQP
jgi:hypothetical protein